MSFGFARRTTPGVAVRCDMPTGIGLLLLAREESLQQFAREAGVPDLVLTLTHPFDAYEAFRLPLRAIEPSTVTIETDARVAALLLCLLHEIGASATNPEVVDDCVTAVNNLVVAIDVAESASARTSQNGVIVR